MYQWVNVNSNWYRRFFQAAVWSIHFFIFTSLFTIYMLIKSTQCAIVDFVTKGTFLCHHKNVAHEFLLHGLDIYYSIKRICFEGKFFFQVTTGLSYNQIRRIRTIRTYIYNKIFVGEWFQQPRLKYTKKTIFEGLDHTKGLQ